MKILIFHGYLLRGTGSNIYNANLAQALAGLGHEVHLLCQDRDAEHLGWVDRIGTWDDSGLTVAGLRDPAGEGSVTVYRPPIGRLLPVYVEDPYEGFEARAFPRLSDREIDNYIDVNVAAVRDVLDLAGGHDAALANHLVMGPVIFARAGVRPYAVKNHGSDLEYTVKPHPRFVPYVREGLEPAAAVLVGSHHTAASLWQAIPGLDLESRTGMGPPGVDVEEFHPIGPGQGEAQLRELAADIGNGPASPVFGRDEAEAVEALERFAGSAGPRVVFVGKLIVSKGCDLLLAAWPLVVRAHPGARLLLVGFGTYREALLRLWDAFSAGDLAAAREIAGRGRALEGGEEGALRFLRAFLDQPPPGYAEACARARGSVDFAGRLEYGEVARAVRASDAMVVPSTFPEAFGMVAAEAAATGALPLCARHSGLAEVADTLAAGLSAVPAAAMVAPLTAFELDSGAAVAIAARLNAWLALDPLARAAASAVLVDVVRGRWSWERVAGAVLAAAAADLDALDPVPAG